MKPSSTEFDNAMRLWKAPLVKWAGAAAAVCALLWGAYFELGRTVGGASVVMIEFSNYFALAVYSLTALACLLLSGASLQQGMHDREWSEADRLVFQGGLILAAVFFLSGFQYILFGQWQVNILWLYDLYHFVTIGLLFGFLARLIVYEWKMKKSMKNSGPS